jgi:hypothetical protein
MNISEPQRLKRRREAALRVVDERLNDLSHRDNDGPLGTYGFRDFKAALDVANRALSRVSPPVRTADAGPPDGPEAVEMLLKLRAGLVAPESVKQPGHPRRRTLAEIPAHYAPHQTYPRIRAP